MIDNKKFEAEQAKKMTISKWFALFVIAEYILITILILQQEGTFLPLFIGFFSFAFTAITIIFYFRDLFSGVLRPTPEEEAAYERMIEENRKEQERQRK